MKGSDFTHGTHVSPFTDEQLAILLARTAIRTFLAVRDGAIDSERMRELIAEDLSQIREEEKSEISDGSYGA